MERVLQKEKKFLDEIKIPPIKVRKSGTKSPRKGFKVSSIKLKQVNSGDPSYIPTSMSTLNLSMPTINSSKEMPKLKHVRSAT